ncbi:DUF6328 family protein [Nocardioides sp. BP30]|uniref:DUF6328 family protein n=1 Tax=Nocardioides sp. BP30 TaxID=3036374 RepID=UPI002469C25D|nr:DUF6328 family protein [Nocardioides sp. BP30]WGL51755.1 DUF6328 family protein [Nocardioides sp. BP30]
MDSSTERSAAGTDDQTEHRPDDRPDDQPDDQPDDRPDDQPDGRDETHAERMDRLFDDLLQELRVMQTGAQLTSGFLLTLPFQSRFTTLDDFQRGLYLVLVVLALLTTAFVMTAVAVHQRLTGRQVKDRVVEAAQRLLTAVLTTLALLVDGIAMLVFDVVWHRAAAITAGIVLGLVLVGLLVVLPQRMRRLQ